MIKKTRVVNVALISSLIKVHTASSRAWYAMVSVSSGSGDCATFGLLSLDSDLVGEPEREPLDGPGDTTARRGAED